MGVFGTDEDAHFEIVDGQGVWTVKKNSYMFTNKEHTPGTHVLLGKNRFRRLLRTVLFIVCIDRTL